MFSEAVADFIGIPQYLTEVPKLFVSAVRQILETEAGNVIHGLGMQAYGISK